MLNLMENIMKRIFMPIIKSTRQFIQSRQFACLLVRYHESSSLVEAWAELHQEELMAGWNLLLAGQTVEPIKPLQ